MATLRIIPFTHQTFTDNPLCANHDDRFMSTKIRQRGSHNQLKQVHGFLGFLKYMPVNT